MTPELERDAEVIPAGMLYIRRVAPTTTIDMSFQKQTASQQGKFLVDLKTNT
jgi:hypothetical protein